ncbi:hypothetical protein C6H69_23380, partial [Photorhabdus luminescens]
PGNGARQRPQEAGMFNRVALTGRGRTGGALRRGDAYRVRALTRAIRVTISSPSDMVFLLSGYQAA